MILLTIGLTAFFGFWALMIAHFIFGVGDGY
mgnify:CR=1 FL=1